MSALFNKRVLRLYLSESDPAKSEVMANRAVNAILANVPYWACVNCKSIFMALNADIVDDVASEKLTR